MNHNMFSLQGNIPSFGVQDGGVSPTTFAQNLPFVSLFRDLSFIDVIYWIIVLIVLVGVFYIGIRLIKYNHKVLIIDKRGIGRSDVGKKDMKDGTPRLHVLKAKQYLSWPSMTIALNKKRSLIPLIEDNAGQLHTVKIEWDVQAITTDGDYVDVKDLMFDTTKVNPHLKTDDYGHVKIADIPFLTTSGKKVIFKNFPRLLAADTNVMREFIQNNKETIQTYHRPSKWEKLAPYGAFALVVVVSAVYWFVVAKWH